MNIVICDDSDMWSGVDGKTELCGICKSVYGIYET